MPPTLPSTAGLTLTDLSSATVTAVSLSCPVSTTPDQIEEYSSGRAGLQNLGDGYYQFNWRTPKSYAESCKTVRVDLGEGFYHTANFQFE